MNRTDVKGAIGIGAAVGVVAGLFAAFVLAEQNQQKRYEQQRRAAWEGPCADTATLVATSSGSPSSETCTNKRHKLRVQVTTIAGNEVGAVVHCECQSESGGR